MHEIDVMFLLFHRLTVQIYTIIILLLAQSQFDHSAVVSS